MKPKKSQFEKTVAPKKPAQVDDFWQAVKPSMDALVSSAMFALSRGAKELFHTNFIGWVLEVGAPDADGDEALVHARDCLLTKLFDGRDIPEHVLVWREASNLDLVVWACDQAGSPQPRGVVVEAKVKSDHSACQLGRYDERLDRGLTLTHGARRLSVRTLADSSIGTLGWRRATMKVHGIAEPNAEQCSEVRRVFLSFDEQAPVAERLGWASLAWESVAQAHEPSKERAEAASYTAQMLLDHSQSLRNLGALREAVRGYVKTHFIQGKVSLGHLHDCLNDERLRRARLHDLTARYAWATLMDAMYDALGELKAEQPAELRWECFLTQIGAGMTVQAPWPGQENAWLGVQLQNTSYRHYVCLETPNQLLLNTLCNRAGGHIDAFDGWWEIADPESCPEFADTPKNGVRLGVFNRDLFRHRTRDIRNYTFTDLTRLMANSLGQLHRKLDEIQ